MVKQTPILIVFFSILFLGLVSAQYDWKQYGNSWTPMWNEQFVGAYGRFDSGVNVSSLVQTYYPQTNHIHPLVSNLDMNESDPLFKEYLIFPIANYLQIYDKYFTFYDEIVTNGNVVGQIATSDWNRDGKTTEIVGLWDGNVFKAFQYNTTTNKYTAKASLNLSDSPYNFTLGKLFGVRSSGSNSYLIGKDSSNNIYFVTINSTNGSDVVVSQALLNQSGFTDLLSYEEPLSWYDINSDGLNEFLYYDSRQVLLFNQNGNVLFWKNTTAPSYYTGASLLQVDATGQWRIAILGGSSGASTGGFSLTLYRQDGSTLWSKSVLSNSGSYFASHCKMAVSDDYDGDTFNNDNEVYVACYFSYLALGHKHFYKIYKGYNGNLLMAYETSGYIAGTPSSIQQLTIADMNHDNKQDFISSLYDSGVSYLDIWSSASNYSIYNYSMGSQATPYCIPADINVDGFQEVICQTSSTTYYFYSGNVSNQNPTISSVAYDPSINVALGQTLYMTITATDTEGNPIFYSSKCSNSDSWTTDSYASTQNCLYSSVGEYNNSVRVRDGYHSTYNTFSQTIYVTESGSVCDNDDICESEQGETYITCPNDCTTPTTPTQQSSVNGSMVLPTKIVDTENTEQGLLPEVYYGILGFLSSVLSPTIVLVFVIFFVLIILALGTIIRRIADKVGG